MTRGEAIKDFFCKTLLPAARTLWDDIFSFAIPDEGKTEFDSNSEYFLGPIVTFRNEDKLEVIDGQQRLTTLMLLLEPHRQRSDG